MSKPKHSWREADDLPANYARVILWLVPHRENNQSKAGQMVIAWRQPNGWSFDKAGEHPLKKIVVTHWRPLPWPPPHVSDARYNSKRDAETTA